MKKFLTVLPFIFIMSFAVTVSAHNISHNNSTTEYQAISDSDNDSLLSHKKKQPSTPAPQPHQPSNPAPAPQPHQLPQPTPAAQPHQSPQPQPSPQQDQTPRLEPQPDPPVNIAFTSLLQDKITIGFNHYNMRHSTDNINFYIEDTISNKITVGLERHDYSSSHSEEWKTLDSYVQYKINQKVHLIIGDRSYGEFYDSHALFYGIGIKMNIAPKLNSYASFTTGNYTNMEWKAGVTYDLNKNYSLNIGYKSTKDDNGNSYNGIGFGLNDKF